MVLRVSSVRAQVVLMCGPCCIEQALLDDLQDNRNELTRNMERYVQRKALRFRMVFSSARSLTKSWPDITVFMQSAARLSCKN